MGKGRGYLERRALGMEVLAPQPFVVLSLTYTTRLSC